jgi:hypothetical protein
MLEENMLGKAERNIPPALMLDSVGVGKPGGALGLKGAAFAFDGPEEGYLPLVSPGGRALALGPADRGTAFFLATYAVGPRGKRGKGIRCLV